MLESSVAAARAPNGSDHRPMADVQSWFATLPFDYLIRAVEALGANVGKPEAISLYRRWIGKQDDDNPHLFAAWFNLGVELSRAGDRTGAVAAYRACLALRTDFHLAALNLGLVLESDGNPDAALHVWGAALQADEARIALFNQRARLLEQLGRLEEAEQVLRSSLIADPAQPDVIQHWLHVRQKACQWPVLNALVPGLSETEQIAHSGPIAALALTDDVLTQRRVTQRWIERKMPPAPARLAPNRPYPHDRIRVGYVSSDFCRHAMSYLIAELIERHDRGRFEVYGYCASPEDGSDIRRRVTSAFDVFRRIAGLDDARAAEMIRGDEIDVLIDLNGLTAGTRLAILRWRPAPIQATYLGFVGPVPLPELDFLLADDFVIPAEEAPNYAPTPLSIGPIYQANDGARAIGRATTRAEAGLPDGRFVFCCFSNHYKITEAMFSAWMEILRQVPNAVLWLSADFTAARGNLERAAQARAVAADRLIFAPRVDPAAYMARLRLADLFLDTSPYNAGTIASDAIRMGLPLITLQGMSFASRMAARLLRAINAEEGIATTLDGYISTAVRLATDPAAHAGFRSRFGEAAWRDTLGDTAAFTTAFEATLARVVGAAAAEAGATDA